MKNKILILTLIFILVLSSCSTAFADTSLVSNGLDGFPEFPTEYNTGSKVEYYDSYIIEHIDTGYRLWCWSSSVSGRLYLDAKGITVYCEVATDFRCFLFTNNEWDASVSLGSISPFNINNIYYSSVDIYESNAFTSIHFPQATPVLLGLTAPEIQRQTMKELLGLVPLVIGLMICWMGLRKALAMLLGRLKQA